MEKSKVYFCDLYSNSENRNLPNNVRRLFEKAEFKDLIIENGQVAIKLHFGERGNSTYISPIAVRQVVDKVKEYKGKPFLTDTNTLYTGSRTNSVDHINTAIENGFSYSVVNAPIIIADGLYSRNSVDVEINQKHFDKVKIGGEIYNSSSMIVITHFKGHEMGGFGGTLKNLAMGCATAAGKQMQHSDVKPTVDKNKCIGCTKCVRSCPTSAISMKEKKAVIDHDVCYGCGECPTVCPTRAISVEWESDKDIFIEKMAEFAYGSVLNKKDKVGYIAFVMNITPDCDCVPWSNRPIAHDIGILASKDPVALEQACYDLICKEMGHDVFKHQRPHINATRIIDYAYEMGLGNKEYELINI